MQNTLLLRFSGFAMGKYWAPTINMGHKKSTVKCRLALVERYVHYKECDLKKKMMELNEAENLLLVPYCLRVKYTKIGSCDTGNRSSDAEIVGYWNNVPPLHESFSFTVDDTEVADISAGQAV